MVAVNIDPHEMEGALRVEINTAVRAQLLTMSAADQKRVRRAVDQLEANFPNVSGLRKVGQELWSLRVTPQIRMLLRTLPNALRIVALARPEQIQRYSVRRHR